MNVSLFSKLVLGLIVISLAPLTFACSCMPASLPEAYAEHDVVFTGEVKRISRQFSIGASRFKNKVDIKPDKMYKGDKTKKITVYTASDSAACGYPFEKKQRYAVFAYYPKSELEKKPSKRKLQVGLCGATTNLSDTQTAQQKEVLDFLETGKAPIPPRPLPLPITPKGKDLPAPQVAVFESDLEAIKETNRRVEQAFKNQDIPDILRYHHPQVQKAISWEETQIGHADMTKALSNFFKDYNVAFLPIEGEPNIQLFGDSAAMLREFKLLGTPKSPDKEGFLFEGRTLILYVRYPDSPTGWVTAREMIMPAP